MKKSTLAILACVGALMSPLAAVPALAESTSPTDSTVYYFDNFNDETLVEVFKTALDNGRNYPTDAEFEAAGISLTDIAFVRSHVRRAEILPRTDRLVSKTYETRNLWMNIPMDIGKDAGVGYPDGDFGSDVYSMWQYTHLFGSWNHGFFQAPGAWVDAAHKNGTDIMSGIKFFDTTGSANEGATGWMKFCTAKNDDGTFAYVKPIINCLMFFGSDGINFNWEATGYSDEDIVAFHKALYKEAAAQGFDNFHIGLYTAVSTLTSSNSNALYGNSEGQTVDLMLNYSGGDFSYGLVTSVKAAEAATGSADRLYTGVWYVTMNRGWSRLDADETSHKINVCLWGEHAQSRFMSYNTGTDAYDVQDNYQRLLERAFSGGNRNPATRPAVSNTGNNFETDSEGNPPLSTFCGLSEFIPERSAIQGNLPFETYFNLGNGDRYLYKGKKTGSSWYNMANQDRVPTYRWLVYNAGTETVSTDIQPEFSHSDAYTGGSCLSLTGKATASGTDVILYKTKLKVSNGTPVAKVAVKNGKTGNNPSNLYVLVRTEAGKWCEFPVGSLTGSTWEEKTVDMNSLAQGTVIDRIGFRVKGSDDAYSLYVGKLKIADDFIATPASIKDLVAEVKQESKSSMSLKLNWKTSATAVDRSKWDLVYNDEANIDHFEILYKNGANGRVSEVGRTTQWATFVNAISFTDATDDPYIGVRSVSTDLRTYSPIEWLHVTRSDQSALPEAVEANPYGEIVIDPSSDGVENARTQRYIEKATTTGATQNLSYSASSTPADGTQYVDARDHVIKVQQGQTITFTFNTPASYTDGLEWCLARGWMDFNGDYSFERTMLADDASKGECLFELGSVRKGTPAFKTGTSVSFTIPSDARTGKSCFRVVFCDAWFTGSLVPVGKHNKGFAIDFGVEISGNNAQRAIPGDSHDQGTAEEPEGIGTSDGIHAATSNEVSEATVDGDAIIFNNVDKAWVYGVDGRLVSFIKSANGTATGLTPGNYVVKMQYKNVVRSQKVSVK